MKYNKYMRHIANGFLPYSLIDCLSILSKEEKIPFQRCLPAAASGTAAVLFLSDKIEQRYKDVTFYWNSHPLLLKNILKQTGREYEVIQKFGGVYSEPYYIYRIVQSLKSKSPILCKSRHARENWCLLIGYDGKNKSAYLKTPLGIVETKTLYQDIDDMIILSNETKRAPAGCLPNDFINAVTTMERVSLCESGNDDAYDHWIRFLKDLSSDVPEMYQVHHHLLHRLLRDRSDLYVYCKQDAFWNEWNDGFKTLRALLHRVTQSLLSNSIVPETLISQVDEIQHLDQLLRSQLYSYFK